MLCVVSHLAIYNAALNANASEHSAVKLTLIWCSWNLFDPRMPLLCEHKSPSCGKLLLWKLLQPPPHWFCLPTLHFRSLSLSSTSNIAAGWTVLEDNLGFATFHLRSHHCPCAGCTMKWTCHSGPVMVWLFSVIFPTVPFTHSVLQPNWTIRHVRIQRHFFPEAFPGSSGGRKSVLFLLLSELWDHASCVSLSHVNWLDHELCGQNDVRSFTVALHWAQPHA